MWVRLSPSAPPLCVQTDRSAGHGGILWDASLVLAWWLHNGGAAALGLGPTSRVLEIGAGCGLPGIAAAACTPGAAAVLTDKPALVPLLWANAQLNGGLLGGRVAVAPLTWGGALRKLPDGARPPYDVVLASDVLGCADDGAFDALIKTLRDCLAANPAATVAMAYRPRAAWEARFFARASEEERWRVRLAAEVGGAALEAIKAAALVAATPELGERGDGRFDGLVEAGDGSAGAAVQVLLLSAAAGSSADDGGAGAPAGEATLEREASAAGA